MADNSLPLVTDAGARTATRRDRLRAVAVEADLDAIIISNLVNVRYLTGFTGSNAALLVRPNGADVLATDGRYTTQARAQAPDLEIVIERACAPALAGLAARNGALRLGYESHVVTIDGLAHLQSAMAGLGSGTEPVSIHAAVETLRAIKDGSEIEALRAACGIADRALASLIADGALRAGRTEREVGRDLDNRMLSLGAEAVSFETIVAAGANSAIPHHRPDEAVLAGGDFVKLDFGATYAGYHSDMTRTFVLGAPAAWQRDIYDLVATSQRLGREALTVGAAVVDVDAAARTPIVEAGHGPAFTHGLGHGVGLEIHEAPGLSALGAGKLEADMVVTVEPGVYLPGRGGVRIEDTLVVGTDGPDLLTLTSKELVAL
ncbi:MAG: Xaa-Pro peptidase family protein [Actinomycetota bacterium]|nr:Xaa-Pro peptidase family protein [Actinomycetota bacterium]